MRRVYAEQKLARDGEGEIPVRQLDDERVAVVGRIAKIRERVLVAALRFRFAGPLQQQVRLAHEVERDVRERDVLLEDRPVPAPLAQPVAKHQAVVAVAEQVFEELRAHRLPTPRGTL